MRYILLSVLAMMLALSPTIEGVAQSQKPKKITRQTTTQQTEAQKKAEQEAAKRRQQAAAEKRRQEEAARKQAEERARQEEQRRQEELRRQQVAAVNRVQVNGNITFTVNGVQFTMIGVQGGTFQMGSNDGKDWEKPVHSVTLSSYYIGQTEVTQKLWTAVMGSNPSIWKGDNLPVEMVSWNDCQNFITKLNALTGEKFRLPTEAEWEFAAKGGNKSKGYRYNGSNTIGDVAWYDGNSGNKTHAVGTKAPNELGIYDMSGNVWEWCQDRYGSYSNSAQTNPTGPASGSFRVSRGGSWFLSATFCRTAYRSSLTPTNTNDTFGFRLALSN